MRKITWHKPRNPAEDELRSILQKEGLTPYTYVLERDENTGVVRFDHDETRILLEGAVEFHVEGRLHTLKPGDRIDMPKQTPHAIKNIHPGQSIMVCGSKEKPTPF